MNRSCLIILIINSFAYIISFIIYQYKKKAFDIGSILLLAWVIGSVGAVYYYTFEVAYLSYDKITFIPLIFLFFVNYLLFNPFLKTNYRKISSVNSYNLGKVFNIISIFFSIITIPALVDVLHKLTSFSLAGAALAEMYASDEDKVALIFSPFGKIFYSLLRHFTIFIIFLFFYQLTRKQINKLIVIGLGLSIITFLLVSLLSGSRGGIMSIIVVCSYFLLFLRNMYRPEILKNIMRVSYIICSIIILGIAMISLSRLSDMSEKKGQDLLMDQWISQYAGEGIIQYDHKIWHLEKFLNGQQNLPFLYSYIDNSIKDLDTYANKAENIVRTPVTVFYTYVGDLILDFGIIGTIFVVALIYFMITFLIKTRKGKISFYHLILLAYFFEYLTIGFTANIFRTYYTQLSIVETITLLAILYILQKINKKSHGYLSDNNSCVQN